jgi:glycosyltransferase involved in cell wall biosynthesis
MNVAPARKTETGRAPRRLKIMHCLRAPVGGLFRHVLDLAVEQAARGHDVGVMADSTVSDTLTDAKFAAVADHLSLGVLRTPMSRHPGFGDVRAANAVFRHARSLELDVMHGHGAKGGAYARMAARRLSSVGQPVRVFYTPHGGTLNFRPSSVEGMVFHGMERAFTSLTDGLIFESAFAARVYREQVSKAGLPARIVPNGLHPEDFDPVLPGPDSTDVLMIGELRTLKGVDVLLRALALLRENLPLTATIVGEGPDAARFHDLTKDLGIADSVRFTGAMPARAGFALGKIMVVPSLAESFPYIVLEAAAAGLPLIATSVGGIPEITQGTDTELIPAGDVVALATALRRCVDEPAAATRRAERLRTSVADRFTVETMTDAVMDFYASVPFACRCETPQSLPRPRSPQPAAGQVAASTSPGRCRSCGGSARGWAKATPASRPRVRAPWKYNSSK